MQQHNNPEDRPGRESGNEKDPVRVLHWIFNLGTGGVENWLVQLLDHLDPGQFQTDVIVDELGGVQEQKVRQHGSEIFECPVEYRKPIATVRRLREIIRQNGPYDALHCHTNISSGLACLAAFQEGIPVRIAHCRGASRDFQPPGFVRKLHLRTMRWFIRRYATHLLAISLEGARALFGPDIESDPRYRPFVTAIDFSPFGAPVDVAAVREKWSIPADAPVIGHVARFSEYKNHRFIVEMAEELCGELRDAHFLLVGDGDLREEIQEQVSSHGLRKNFTFTGFQGNAPELMRAMDLFVFPSKWEGLGRVVVEAQAAGLPCLISQAVPPEAVVIDQLVHRRPLSDGPEKWAETAKKLLQSAPPLDRQGALACVERSDFNMQESARILAGIYRNEGTHAS